MHWIFGTKNETEAVGNYPEVFGNSIYTAGGNIRDVLIRYCRLHIIVLRRGKLFGNKAELIGNYLEVHYIIRCIS